MKRHEQLKELFYFSCEEIAKFFGAKAKIWRNGPWINVEIVSDSKTVLFSAKGRGYYNTQQLLGQKMDAFLYGTDKEAEE